MKSMTEEKGTVCGVMTFFMLMHLLLVSGYGGDLIRQMCMFPYNLQLQHYMSKMGHQKILYFANHSYREHRSIAVRSLLFYSQMDIADTMSGVQSGEAGCHLDLSYM